MPNNLTRVRRYIALLFEEETGRDRENRSCIKEKQEQQETASHVKGKSKAGSKEKTFEKKERRIKQKTSKKKRRSRSVK